MPRRTSGLPQVPTRAVAPEDLPPPPPYAGNNPFADTPSTSNRNTYTAPPGPPPVDTRPRPASTAGGYASPPQPPAASSSAGANLNRASTVTTESKLAILKRYDTVIVIDDSASMQVDSPSRWSQCRAAVMGVADKVLPYDDDGLDILFINEPRRGMGLRTSAEVAALFDSVGPYGESTPTEVIIEDIGGSYVEACEKAKANKTTLPKPMNVLIITDGAADDPDTLAYAIAGFATRLDEGHFPLGQLGFQFVSLGDDAEALASLQALDDDLKTEHGLKRDIVDTTAFEGKLDTDALLKLLLGGINRKLDNANQVPPLTPTQHCDCSRLATCLAYSLGLDAQQSFRSRARPELSLYPATSSVEEFRSTAERGPSCEAALIGFTVTLTATATLRSSKRAEPTLGRSSLRYPLLIRSPELGPCREAVLCPYTASTASERKTRASRPSHSDILLRPGRLSSPLGQRDMPLHHRRAKQLDHSPLNVSANHHGPDELTLRLDQANKTSSGLVARGPLDLPATPGSAASMDKPFFGDFCLNCGNPTPSANAYCSDDCRLADESSSSSHSVRGDQDDEYEYDDESGLTGLTSAEVSPMLQATSISSPNALGRRSNRTSPLARASTSHGSQPTLGQTIFEEPTEFSLPPPVAASTTNAAFSPSATKTQAKRGSPLHALRPNAPLSPTIQPSSVTPTGKARSGLTDGMMQYSRKHLADGMNAPKTVLPAPLYYRASPKVLPANAVASTSSHSPAQGSGSDSGRSRSHISSPALKAKKSPKVAPAHHVYCGRPGCPALLMTAGSAQRRLSQPMASYDTSPALAPYDFTSADLNRRAPAKQAAYLSDEALDAKLREQRRRPSEPASMTHRMLRVGEFDHNDENYRPSAKALHHNHSAFADILFRHHNTSAAAPPRDASEAKRSPPEAATSDSLRRSTSVGPHFRLAQSCADQSRSVKSEEDDVKHQPEARRRTSSRQMLALSARQSSLVTSDSTDSDSEDEDEPRGRPGRRGGATINRARVDREENVSEADDEQTELVAPSRRSQARTSSASTTASAAEDSGRPRGRSSRRGPGAVLRSRSPDRSHSRPSRTSSIQAQTRRVG
ncbi:uncharacterized protein L969DRAFT_52400 [Mixia osmundae IAM 14324]|uniref:VWFA domain-containing protein n=1 Tax=Mixia osmundae (strain CBS 9802 / IAM 14324 / JCM 22182 / KY 12970) TaxID=764103 RepID=G7EA69_MIXOS|nr:uncharacterized protein L969DRAFT_52400 [Mixia osmundae IAM 14324]KEI37627.1 hypothetical protein L969DRAFT_52400 [Mixia osmundae IAM 14324]GAA99729.1 hypothetical protein E5Q_06432 [Mixia osmundae IAM 14324]